MATTRRKPGQRAKRPVARQHGLPFTQLRALLGKPIDDAAVKAALARAGTTFVPKAARGQLIVARDAGFDLSLSPRDGKRGAPLVIDSLSLYREGVATPGCPARARADYVHCQYDDPPFALGFGTRVELLARAPKPRETWLWGTGAVAVDAKLVSYDEWLRDGLQVQVHYTQSVDTPASSADAAVQHVIVELAKPA